MRFKMITIECHATDVLRIFGVGYLAFAIVYGWIVISQINHKETVVMDTHTIFWLIVMSWWGAIALAYLLWTYEVQYNDRPA